MVEACPEECSHVTKKQSTGAARRTGPGLGDAVARARGRGAVGDIGDLRENPTTYHARAAIYSGANIRTLKTRLGAGKHVAHDVEGC